MIDEIKRRIGLGKFDPKREEYEQWVFQRGWNEAIDFSLGQIKKVENERNRTQRTNGPDQVDHRAD